MLARTARRALPAVALVTVGLAAMAACGPADSSSSGTSTSASTSGSTSASSTPATSAASSSAATGGSGSTGSTSSTGSTGSTGTTGSSSSGGTTAGSPRAAGGSSVPACATSRLRTTVESAGAGAGHADYQLVFQNTGTAPCSLKGYPGVSFVKIHDIQLGKAASRAPGPVTVVTLIPNAHAYASLRTVNGQGGYTAAQCGLTTVPTLRVYPPNQTESTQIPWNTQECVGSGVQNLEVGPVHANR
ncbi:DUF4232 domain-containing protein [Streptomyces sp. HPF1205]|uniref:DUF4232 domain-containing protein n=1 Tax=Streptomyces sp. HPF1205 TaxID=2873262 RepID=UPI001CED7823|nr:DUF4232 domain-containing protein [Streptomyces sp. HPF1205]